MDTTKTIWLPPQSSTMAGRIDNLFDFILWASVILFIIVAVSTIYFAIRYRRRGDIARTTPYVENLGLEITWTVIPFILLMVIFVWGIRDYLRFHIIPAQATEIKVTGQKWFWSFSYLDGPSTVGELVVPVNKPIKLLMSSQDVIHSFYVPDFRVKMDVLPNRYTVTWFEAVHTGEFQLYCAEFCGKGHSEMWGKVKVLPQDEYKIWLEKSSGPQEGETLEQYGERLFVKKACVTCHSINGSKNVGPTFLGLMGRSEVLKSGQTIVVDENYLRESMLNPMAKVVAGYDPVMPTFQGILKNVDIDGLIAYIKSLEK